jgi:hypothetical protein
MQLSLINHVGYKQKESAKPSQIQLEIKVWNTKAVIENMCEIYYGRYLKHV